MIKKINKTSFTILALAGFALILAPTITKADDNLTSGGAYPSVHGSQDDPSFSFPGSTGSFTGFGRNTDLISQGRSTQDRKYPSLQRGSSGGPNFKGPDGEVKMKTDPDAPKAASGNFPPLTRGSSGGPNFKGPDGEVKMKTDPDAPKAATGNFPSQTKGSSGDPSMKMPGK